MVEVYPPLLNYPQVQGYPNFCTVLLPNHTDNVSIVSSIRWRRYKSTTGNIPSVLWPRNEATAMQDGSLVGSKVKQSNFCRWRILEHIIIKLQHETSQNRAPLYSIKTGHYIQWTRGPGSWGPGTWGPKLACTVHVRTVASSLGEYQAHTLSMRGSVSLIAWNGL